MKRTWRFWIALWLGKTAAVLLKLIGKKGTTLPGRIALQVDPLLIKRLGSGYTDGIILVTGTNGKTTTTNLLAGILQKAGRKIAFNKAGANLVTGIAGAMLNDAGWSGSPRVKTALLEVDEATVPEFCRQVAPRLAVITNFFRDQLDRYGELDTTIRLVRDSLPRETTLVLNGDDPLVAQFGLDRDKVFYYGIERTPQSKKISLETREARFCPRCGEELNYELFHYGQLGIYSCPKCGFARPHPDILATEVRMEEEKLVFSVSEKPSPAEEVRPGRKNLPPCGDDGEYEVALEGYYNLYNALAAFTAARCLGIGGKTIKEGLAEFQAQAGRMEVFALAEGPVTLTLIKNPTGFNQVIHTMLAAGTGLRLFIAINDLAADGRDISWLWDVDFESLALAENRISKVVCSGLRAEEMALRLKYAGIPVGKLVIEHDLHQGISYLQKHREEKERVFVLPTYTALFPLRTVLETYRQGTYREDEGKVKAHA